MVGAALALALAREGFAVAVIESRPPTMAWDDSGYDLRVSAISRASQHLLENIGVWSAIVADRATPYSHMHVWDRPGLGEIHFDAADLAEPNLGFIIENRVIVRALWQALQAADGITLHAPAAVEHQETSNECRHVVLDSGERLQAELIIGADGARSRLRESAGITVKSRDYDHHALVATVSAEQGNQSTAWQRFMRSGPLALLPMQHDLFSIVWSTHPEEAQRLTALDPDIFSDELTAASEARLGELRLLGERGVFPLRLQHAEEYVQPGLALVGDAAHVIHPLAGQGVNLGFLDAGALVEALVDGRTRGRKAGALRTLRGYERSRRGHNTATQLAMDGFKRLFGETSPVVDLARNLGLGAANQMGPVKRLFERVALGQGMDLPPLNRIPRSS